MIDLHCHLLPGIDDGAKSIEMSLEMAQMAVADGITTTACTPHILPGVYNNTGPGIRAAVSQLQEILIESSIPLQLVSGADVHVAPDLGARLADGSALTLNNSRYFLLEPPHHVAPPRLEDHIFGLQSAGYSPILTHPERLSWIEDHYDLVKRLVHHGIFIQITGGSLTGSFGRKPRYWAERMLDDGLCHLLATDGHNVGGRPPCMSDARDLVAQRLGNQEAMNLVLTRAQGILADISPSQLPSPAAQSSAATPSAWTKFMRFGRRGREE